MKRFSQITGKVVGAAAAGYSTFYLASAAFAQSASDLISDIDSSQQGDLLAFVRDALNLVISLSALIAVAVLIYSGLQYILASGDEGKVEKATKGITYAIVGLVICFVAVLIVNFVLTRLLGA